MADDFYGYDDDGDEPKGRDNLFLWTVFILLLIGLAYKKNVDDMRESPALTLIEMLEELGAAVSYHDPFIQRIKPSPST